MPSKTTETSRLRDLQFRAEYGFLRAMVGFVRLFPLETAAGFSAWSWCRLAPIVAKKRHLRALDNVATAFPSLPKHEQRRIVMAHWDNLGRVMVETMQLDRLTADPERIKITSDAVFSRYSNKLGPAIGISLHMGNWELAIWPLTTAKANPAAVYRSVNNPYVDNYLRAQRAELYPGGLIGRGRVEGDHGEVLRTARAITDFVRSGGRLGMVCDLYDRKGIPVPFFGKPAKTQAIGAMIARRLGTRIWLSRCRRVGKSSRFEIEIVELKVPRSKDRSADITCIMTEMQKQFEKWVIADPEQWMWSNRRWS